MNVVDKCLLIDDLYPMQEGLRHWQNLPVMTNHVFLGGFWTDDVLEQYGSEHGKKPSQRIQISRFEDGRCYIHDGHHRCVSVCLGGRKYLRASEYHLKDWKYAQYMNANPANGWYTPYDPRTHVLAADLCEYKRDCERRCKENLLHGLQWIADSISVYRRPRLLNQLPDLALAIQERIQTEQAGVHQDGRSQTASA